jgi:hypothetical protein
MASQISRQESGHLPLSSRRSERRNGARVVLSPCPLCARGDSRVVVRTDYVLYLRRAYCADVWSVAKPGCVQLGT